MKSVIIMSAIVVPRGVGSPLGSNVPIILEKKAGVVNKFMIICKQIMNKEVIRCDLRGSLRRHGLENSCFTLFPPVYTFRKEAAAASLDESGTLHFLHS